MSATTNKTGVCCTLAKHHAGGHDAQAKAGRNPCGATIATKPKSTPTVETDAEVEQNLLAYLRGKPEPEGTLLDDLAGGGAEKRAQCLRVLGSMLTRGLVSRTTPTWGAITWGLAKSSTPEAPPAPPPEPAPAPPVAPSLAPAPMRAERARLRVPPTETPEAHFTRILVEMRQDREAREATARAKEHDMSTPLETSSRKPGELDVGLSAEELLRDASLATLEGGALYETPIGRAWRVLLNRYHKEKAKPVQIGLFTNVMSATPPSAAGAPGNGGIGADPPGPIAAVAVRA